MLAKTTHLRHSGSHAESHKLRLICTTVAEGIKEKWNTWLQFKAIPEFPQEDAVESQHSYQI